jgi:hypothetical protein
MMHKEQPSQIKKRPSKPTPTRPKLIGTGVQKGLLKTPVDVSDKTKPTYFDGMPTIEAEMKPHKLPVYDAEYFEQEIKRRKRDLDRGYLAVAFVLLTALFIGLLGVWMT